MKLRRDYFLITPAKNEEAFIGETISSVLRQTQLPVEWVIVSDGSTDRTEQIVRKAASSHPWITLIVRSSGANRDFGSVVDATRIGLRALKTESYQYVGLLDADVRFQRDYFERVIEEFESSPRLGLAGGMVLDPNELAMRIPRNHRDVPGATQFFRRDCFESLGGLIAVPEGGWDALTCASARLHGYQTKLLTDLVVNHLKPSNSGEGGLFRRIW